MKIVKKTRTLQAELAGMQPDAFRDLLAVAPEPLIAAIQRQLIQRVGRDAIIRDLVDEAGRDFTALAEAPPYDGMQWWDEQWLYEQWRSEQPR